jgi:hypothetical protein
MPKITDSAYRLPVIEALSAFELFDEGTTKPLAIWGVDKETGERGQYVVKFKNSGRMSIKSSAFELIGTWMAKELDLPVVEPVLVNISSEFTDTALKGKEGYRSALQSQGLNFGSKYISGYSNIPDSPLVLPNGLEKTIELVFVFDMFIANTDRGHQKPNVSSNGSQLLIYDHELAFSFLSLITFARNKTPWILTDTDKELYKNHIYYKWLRERKPDLTEPVMQLRCFNSDFWTSVYSFLPKEWQTDQVLEIEPYLSGIIENLPYFAESLNKTIAE